MKKMGILLSALVAGMIPMNGAWADPPQQCGGIAGTPCPEGEFCEFPIGACFPDAAGECKKAKDRCPRGGQDVCGCDGQTYNNQCEAERAGVIVAHRGACEGDCNDSHDCGEGEYCACAVPGECTQEGGSCAPRPELCPLVFDPVCSCDGQTFSNSCFAAMAGACVAHRGECGGGGCSSNEECAANEYCSCPGAGQCDAQGRQCEPRPEICTAQFDPVCGCDGQTYGNSCEAARAGVCVAHQGECAPSGGACTSNADCAPTDYCAFAPGTCGPAGACQRRPEVCIQIYDPVCGCDGQTYGNACVAASQGQSIAHAGECP